MCNQPFLSIYFCLKSVHSCEYDLPSSSNDPRGFPYDSVRNSIMVASIHIRFGELCISLILQTWEKETKMNILSDLFNGLHFCFQVTVSIEWLITDGGPLGSLLKRVLEVIGGILSPL